MNNIKIFTQLEIRKYLRQPITVGFGVIFPIIWIVLNGKMYGNNPSPKLGGVGTIDFMFPAYIFMIVLVTGLSSLPLVIAKNYDNKVIIRYSFTPLKKYQYLLSIYLGGFLTVALSSLTMFVLGYLAFDLKIPKPANILFLVISVFFIFCGIASIGIIIASVVKGFQATLSISLLFYFVLLFLSGATVPLPVFPTDLGDFIKSYIPFSRIVMFLQNIWLNDFHDFKINFLTSSLLVFVSFILAVKLFKWKK